MQVSVDKITDLERRLTVVLPKEELTHKINERLETLKEQVSIEGFRPGKAPLDVVRSMHGDQIQNEVVSDAINQSLQQALAQEQLTPVDKPVVEIDTSTSEDILRYSATFEVMPLVDIQPVERIKLVQPIVEVTESDIDKLVENLRSQRLTWQPVNRPAQVGDRITVDYRGTVDGKEFSGATAQGLPVVIGEGSLIPGLEDQLIGLKPSDSENIKAAIPESFPAPEYRGKEANFEVKVLRVEKAHLPDLNDIFFRSFGVHEGGLGSFRDQLKHTMEIEIQQKILGTIKTAMLDQLLEMHVVSVPESMLKLEVERMKSVAGENQANLETDDDLATQARYRVSCGIILTELANKLGVSTTPEGVREKIEFLAQSYENPDEVVAWYYSSQEQLASVEAMVNEELLVDYVLKHGQITNQPMSFTEIMES